MLSPGNVFTFPSSLAHVKIMEKTDSMLVLKNARRSLYKNAHMKRLLLLLLLVSCAGLVQAQDVVKWKVAAKKIADKTFEVRFSATVQQPWHIYSQTTPEGGPLPTVFNFAKNPLLKLEGKVKETGKVKKKFEEVFEIDVIYFDGNAEFVQVVKLKGNAMTNFAGSIEFMACTEEQCLPPDTYNFSVQLK